MKTTSVASAAILALALSSTIGCAAVNPLYGKISIETFGADFDDLCIAGKLKGESADWLNMHPEEWKQHTDYTDQRKPDLVKKGDRIFNGDCSEASKKLFTERDLDGAMEALRAVAAGAAEDE
jgi:hypothetical protein